jgi:hypothetical protein
MIRALLVVALCAVPALRAQGRPETVRGRVTSPSGSPVAAAAVTVTRTTDGVAKSTATDSLGSYAVDWPSAAGGYLVQISASGYQTFRKIVPPADSSSVIVLNATLQPGQVAQLAAVVTKATRPTPDRQHEADPGPGAVDAVSNPMYASRRLPPDLAGDLNALAAMTPGVLATASGISVLGLGPTQNLVTLNGLAFPSGDIPRATPTLVHLTTSSYDPSIGWFSGARTNVDLAPGGPFTARTAYWTADAPALQFTDATGAQSGQRYGNVDASLGGSGQLAADRLAYSFGAQAGHKLAQPATLLNANDGVLAHAGLAADSVVRVLSLLRQLGIPLAANSGQSTVFDRASFLGRIDYAPYDWNTLTPATRTFGLTAYGKVSHVAGQSLAATATPAHAGQSSQAVAAVQAAYSFYFGDGYLADVRTGITSVHSTSSPYLTLPDGRAFIASALGASNALSTVQFGGNGALSAASGAWTWESQTELQFYPAAKSTHRVKLTLDSRLDGNTQSLMTDPLGLFTYNSLSDLANNTPAAFSRTLAAPQRGSGVWNGFAAAGDLWRPAQNLQIAYGLRADANTLTRVPAYDATTDSTFGVRTDRGPGSLALSPRAGFTYGTQTPHWINPSTPLGVLHGGFGAFRNLLDPTVMAAASAATGLAGTLRQLTCVGSAVPAADWAAFAADSANVPRQCLGGTPTLADATQDVVVVDPHFRPTTSWRTNLGWSSSAGNTLYSIDGTYSLNLSQPGTVNLNFSGVPQLTLDTEGRPIYATIAGIVPSTGVVSAVDARRVAAFGPVTNTVSEMRSVSRQLTLTTRPYLGSWIKRYTGDFAVAYTLSGVRSLQRGFDATTYGDPSVPYWSRADLDARHQFVGGMNIRPRDGVNLFLFGHVQSGLPFTPIVGSDVNGDGLANDRAFIFDPARADSAVSSGMRQLLVRAPRQVRDCLARQQGHAANPASCDGPWSATLNLAVLLDPPLLHLPRATVTLNFANVLGGIDLLAHGGNNLKGWGGAPNPDPVLYRVTGFDPAAKRFSYQVNPRFGSTSASSSIARTPFRITLDVNIDVAPPMSRQQLDRWLRPGRGGHTGTRLSASDLARRYARSVPNPYTQLLQQSDSLVLTADQIAAVQRADDRFRLQMDSIWRALGAELAALPDDYDAAAADKRADRAVDAAWELARTGVQAQLTAILSPVQRSMLSGWTKVLFTAARPLHYRLFISGS